MFRFDKELPGNVCSYNEMSFDDLFHSCLFFFSSFFSFTIDSTVVSFNFSVWHFNISVWQKEVPNSVSGHDKLWRILTINSIVPFLCWVWQRFLFNSSFPCFYFTKIFHNTLIFDDLFHSSFFKLKIQNPWNLMLEVYGCMEFRKLTSFNVLYLYNLFIYNLFIIFKAWRLWLYAIQKNFVLSYCRIGIVIGAISYCHG